jgi:hypothetical protein
MIAGDKTDMHSDPISQSLFSSSQSLSSLSTSLKAHPVGPMFKNIWWVLRKCGLT